MGVDELTQHELEVGTAGFANIMVGHAMSRFAWLNRGSDAPRRTSNLGHAREQSIRQCGHFPPQTQRLARVMTL
ncbi:hypothetical protein [Saccharopolyspora sp. NPDC049426]|uniref:hypothetical protein n=1 Tax=Saccharopolyspora sp. NPDC049426 TaxID=3155652 RepID=UPI00343C9C65